MFSDDLEIHIPTDEEEAAIQKEIAMDPDAPEWTDENWARARPAIEVDPELVAWSRQTRTQREKAKERVSIQLDGVRELRDAKWFIPTLDALTALPRDSDIETSNLRSTETSILETLTILAKILDSRTPPPSVVPTWDGGVQVEWHRNGVDLEIEISPDGNAEYFFASPNEEHEGAARDEIERLTKYARTVL